MCFHPVLSGFQGRSQTIQTAAPLSGVFETSPFPTARKRTRGAPHSDRLCATPETWSLSELASWRVVFFFTKTYKGLWLEGCSCDFCTKKCFVASFEICFLLLIIFPCFVQWLFIRFASFSSSRPMNITSPKPQVTPSPFRSRPRRRPLGRSLPQRLSWWAWGHLWNTLFIFHIIFCTSLCCICLDLMLANICLYTSPCWKPHLCRRSLNQLSSIVGWKSKLVRCTAEAPNMLYLVSSYIWRQASHTKIFQKLEFY